MSMNLTKLAKNLALRTLNTQKPHSDFIILIVFKTEIVVWFYCKASFCPTSFLWKKLKHAHIKIRLLFMTKKRLFMTKSVDMFDFFGGGVKYNYNAFYYVYSN